MRRLARGLESGNVQARWLARAELLELEDARIEDELPRIVAGAILDQAADISLGVPVQVILLDGCIVRPASESELALVSIEGTVRETLGNAGSILVEERLRTQTPLLRDPSSERDGIGRAMVLLARRCLGGRSTTVAVATQRGPTEVWFLAPLDDRGATAELLRRGLPK